MTKTRYTYTKEPTTKAWRKKWIKERKKDIQESIKYYKSMIETLKESKKVLQAPKEITVQHTLNPGDEGYEKAPVHINPTKYQGDIKWTSNYINARE